MYKKLASSIPLVTAQNNVFVGDGATLAFSGTLTTIVLESSISISYTIATVGYTATDDGAGNITGTDLTGTIDYTTGALSLTFTVAPDNATNISVDYNIIEVLYTTPTTFGTSATLFVVNSSSSVADTALVYLKASGDKYGLTSNLIFSSDIAAKSSMEINMMLGKGDSIDIQSTNGTLVFSLVGQEV